MVELAALTDPALVPHAVASVLGVRERSDRSLLDALVTHLSCRQVLQVLDNCEHLVTACAELADALYTAAQACARSRPAASPCKSGANEPGEFPRWQSLLRIRSCLRTSSCDIPP